MERNIAIEQAICVRIDQALHASNCVEIANDPNVTAKLIELGLRSLSMRTTSIPKVKDVILKL